MFLKMAAQTSQAGDFLNIFLKFFWIFEAHCLIKNFLTKNRVYFCDYCLTFLCVFGVILARVGS